MCAHLPHCPPACDPRCCTARVVADHSEQGWCKLCNGLIVFDDGWFLAPDGQIHAVPMVAG